MGKTLQVIRNISLANLHCIWRYRSVLLLPGLVIVAIDFVSLQYLGGLVSLQPVLQLFSMALLVTVAITMHRTVLVGDTKFNLGWGMREVKYLLATVGILMLGLLVLVFMLNIAVNILGTIFLPAEYPMPTSMDVSKYAAPEPFKTRFSFIMIASGIVGLAGLSIVLSRLSMLLPQCAIDESIDIVDAWHSSKDYQYSLFWLSFIPILLFLPLGILLRNMLLAPLVLAAIFLLQVFILNSFSVAYHLIESESE